MRATNNGRRRPRRTRVPFSSLAWGFAAVLLFASPIGAFRGESSGRRLASESTGSTLPEGPTLVGDTGTFPILPATEPFSLVEAPGGSSPGPARTANAWAYPGLYNAAPGAVGSVGLSNPGAPAPFSSVVNFSQVQPRIGGVVGYPEVQYGPKPWCAAAPCASPPMDDRLRLPSPLSSLPNVRAGVGFRVDAPPGPARTPCDLAFDLWLTRHPGSASVGRGDVEVMVWLYYSDPAILPGDPVEVGPIPGALGPSSAPPAWAVYVQHGDRSEGPGVWTIVYFVLAHPVPTLRADIGISPLLAHLTTVLAAEYPSEWGAGNGTGREDPSSLYLNDIELGSEFRPAGGGPAGPAHYLWSITSYTLGIAPQVPPTGASTGARSSAPDSTSGWVPLLAVLAPIVPLPSRRVPVTHASGPASRSLPPPGRAGPRAKG